ncbi:hypothetical protein [Pseudomonas sp. dw_358]|uniref:hypothetical protein n=1 Tax=Pseudomonas sp. dw_358 TaxID=2720083 RepID=UPI001BD24357|nr:hypothetical protein [Pseudomonas sp. dw_358]
MEDDLMVPVPMAVIKRIQNELRLPCGIWDSLAKCVEQASNSAVLACDVRLPPATTFPAGTKVSTMLMGVQMRAGRPDRERKFKEPA